MSAAPRPMARDEAAALLGVDAGAAAVEVQKAFLRAARQVHPDVLPNADEGERRAAAARFDALVRARAVLLDPFALQEPAGSRPVRSPAPRPAAGRSLGDSLVVITLLAFLIVALVTLDGALRGHAMDPTGGTSTGGTSIAP